MTPLQKKEAHTMQREEEEYLKRIQEAEQTNQEQYNLKRDELREWGEQ